MQRSREDGKRAYEAIVMCLQSDPEKNWIWHIRISSACLHFDF